MSEKFTTITLKVKNVLGQTDLNRIKKMSDAELEKNALSDKDNLPLTPAQLAQFRPVKLRQKINIKDVREKLGLSQEKFAAYFGVSVRTLQDWEQGRHQPNRTAMNFLIVVAKEPQAVQRALR